MFNKDQNNPSPKEVETIIGLSVKVEGNFVSQGNVVVDGSVQGTLKTQHNLRVGKDAKVKADVEVANLFVAGEIRGNIKVSEKTELTSTAKIIGNLETKILSVETGAVLHGKCSMIGETRETNEKRNGK